MSNDTAEILWHRLHGELKALSERVLTADPTLSCSLGRTATETFLLRGYLTFMKSSDGDELAITIDVQQNGLDFRVDSDICLDDGRVVATGPSASFLLPESRSNVEAAMDSWLNSFERFLLEQEAAVMRAVAQLS